LGSARSFLDVAADVDAAPIRAQTSRSCPPLDAACAERPPRLIRARSRRFSKNYLDLFLADAREEKRRHRRCTGTATTGPYAGLVSGGSSSSPVLLLDKPVRQGRASAGRHPGGKCRPVSSRMCSNFRPPRVYQAPFASSAFTRMATLADDSFEAKATALDGGFRGYHHRPGHHRHIKGSERARHGLSKEHGGPHIFARSRAATRHSLPAIPSGRRLPWLSVIASQLRPRPWV